MKKNRKVQLSLRVVFLFVILVSSFFYTYLSWSLPMGTPRAPGAGFLPRIVGISACLLSCFLLLLDLRLALQERYVPPTKLVHSQRFIWLILSFAVYVIFFQLLGYVIATILLTFALSVLLGNRVVAAIIIAMVTGIALYVVFSALAVPLPKGLLSGIV